MHLIHDLVRSNISHESQVSSYRCCEFRGAAVFLPFRFRPRADQRPAFSQNSPELAESHVSTGSGYLLR